MIGRFKTLLGERSGGAARHAHTVEDKHLAAAVLMVEAARLDQNFSRDEREKVAELIERRFGLAGTEAEALIAAAETAQDEANELSRFTRAVKETFSADERVELIEMLWEVAYADGELHPYEANLLRRVAGLIYVSDRERGQARRRVLERLGLDQAARA